MKKIFITTLILVTTLFMVGCVSAESKGKNDTINQQVYENTESDKKIEKLYNKYTELLPKVQTVLESNAIEYEVVENEIDDKKYSNYSSIIASEENEVGKFTDISYNLGFNSKDEISDFRIVMFFNIDIDEIKSNGFKFEETMFNDIAKILIGDGIDYSETNNKINDLYDNDTEDIIINEYDNIKEKITVSNNSIGYSITINP